MEPVPSSLSSLLRCAIAGLLLITECMVTEIPEKKEAPAGGHPGMGGMDM